MKFKLHAFSLGLALLAFSGCNKDLSPLNGAATSWKPPVFNPCSVPADPYMWCDFETDPSNNWWGGGPSILNQSWAYGVAHSGCHSWKNQQGIGAGYGHWIGITFGTPPATPVGMNNIEISIQININLTTTFYIDEGSAAGGQGQGWSRSVSWTNTAGSFATFTYPLSSFTTTDPGDSIVNTEDVVQIWFYHNVPYLGNSIYIDDIRFTP